MLRPFRRIPITSKTADSLKSFHSIKPTILKRICFLITQIQSGHNKYSAKLATKKKLFCNRHKPNNK